MKKLLIPLYVAAALFPLKFVSMEKPKKVHRYTQELGMPIKEEKIDCRAKLTIKNETGHTCLVLIGSTVFTLPAGIIGELGISENLSFYKTTANLAYAEAKVKYKHSQKPDLILKIFRDATETPIYRTEFSTFPFGEEKNTHAKEVETEGSIDVTIILRGSVMQDSVVTANGDNTKCTIQ